MMISLINIVPSNTIPSVSDGFRRNIKFSGKIWNKSARITIPTNQTNEFRGQPGRSLLVDLGRYWLHMKGINARLHFTKMVKLESFRNWSHSFFVAKSVSGTKSAISAIKFCISIFITFMFPNPTRSLESTILNRVIILCNKLSTMNVADGVKRWLLTTTKTKLYFRQGVTSFGGVTRRVLRNCAWPPYYLAIDQKEVY